jgi:hypothetical protein
MTLLRVGIPTGDAPAFEARWMQGVPCLGSRALAFGAEGLVK